MYMCGVCVCVCVDKQTRHPHHIVKEVHVPLKVLGTIYSKKWTQKFQLLIRKQ